MIGNRLDTIAWTSVSTQVFVCPVWSCHTKLGFPLHSRGLLRDQFRHLFSLTLAAPPRCGLAIPPILLPGKKKQRECDSRYQRINSGRTADGSWDGWIIPSVFMEKVTEEWLAFLGHSHVDWLSEVGAWQAWVHSAHQMR